MTVTIEVIQDGALDLLSGMERLELIRLYKTSNITAGEKRLSEQFAGALLLSDTVYEDYQNTLREGRNQWSRDIY